MLITIANIKGQIKFNNIDSAYSSYTVGLRAERIIEPAISRISGVASSKCVIFIANGINF
jgi:hypothetical protein